MKRALIAAGLLLGIGLVAAPAQAQTGTARGKVLDAQDQPIQDVKITLVGAGAANIRIGALYMACGAKPGNLISALSLLIISLLKRWWNPNR